MYVGILLRPEQARAEGPAQAGASGSGIAWAIHTERNILPRRVDQVIESATRRPARPERDGTLNHTRYLPKVGSSSSRMGVSHFARLLGCCDHDVQQGPSHTGPQTAGLDARDGGGHQELGLYNPCGWLLRSSGLVLPRRRVEQVWEIGT